MVLLLQSRVGSISGNATLVVSVPGHHDVAIHTPVSAPAAMRNLITGLLGGNVLTCLPVLDQPVVPATVNAIARDKHGMIHIEAGAA